MYLDPLSNLHYSNFLEVVDIEIKNTFPIDIVPLKRIRMVKAVVDS
jgi:hypothetical protein